MKKQTNLPAGGRKLTLSKRTISNLKSAEMNRLIGGASWFSHLGCSRCGGHCGGTGNGNTCPGHNTCYSC